MSIKINPRKIKGKWLEGFALDLHTTGSSFLGHDAFGNPQFDTSRTPLGDLLFRLKYRFDPGSVELIVTAVMDFLRAWKPQVDMLIPVPASNTARKHQPVLELAKAIADRTGIKLCDDAVAKTKQTQQLKNVFDYKQRIAALENVFAIEKKKTSGKRILLFDDLYRSGATLNAIAEKLTKDGEAAAVFALTITRTRSKL